MSDTNNDDMNEFWNGDGGRKWVRYQKRLDSSLIAFGQKAMSIANISSGERVLDIGCGCGDTSLEIAGKVGAYGRVTGVDVSKVILQQAQRRAASVSNVNTKFGCLDAQYHDFELLDCDLVYSRFGVMFFSDPVLAFQNIRKALRPGGRMAFICWQPLKANQWITLPLEIAAKYAPLPAPSKPDAPGPFSFGDADRVTGILEAAGFGSTTIQGHETTFNLGETPDDAAKFISTIGPASFLIDDPDIGGIVKSRFINELRETLASHETTHGVELNAATWIVSAFNQ